MTSLRVEFESVSELGVRCPESVFPFDVDGDREGSPPFRGKLVGL